MEGLFFAGLICGRLWRGVDFAGRKACTARCRVMLSVKKSRQKNFGAEFVVAWRRGVDFAGCKAGTPTRRGPTFVCARRRGLRSISGCYPYGIDTPPTLRRSSFPRRALRPAGAPYQNALGAVPQDPLTLKLRLDTNDALASSVQRRRYALKVPAAHFYVEIVVRVPLPRIGGGGRGCGAERRQWRMQRGGAPVAVEKIEQASSAKIFSGTARRWGQMLPQATFGAHLCAVRI